MLEPPDAPSSVGATLERSSVVGLLPSSLLGMPSRGTSPGVAVPTVNANVGATEAKACVTAPG